jgi:succinate-acetate transporter protein
LLVRQDLHWRAIAELNVITVAPYCIELSNKNMLSSQNLRKVLNKLRSGIVNWLHNFEGTQVVHFGFLWLYWGYIVTFTKVLTIYHSWIHPLHRSLGFTLCFELLIYYAMLSLSLCKMQNFKINIQSLTLLTLSHSFQILESLY